MNDKDEEIKRLRAALTKVNTDLAEVTVNHRYDCPMRQPDRKVDRMCSLGVLHMGQEPSCDCHASVTETQIKQVRDAIDVILAPEENEK